ncbi:hypothetical protein [Actinoplanes sp. GCM10030250]|uniref:hypothetical protein n=1 Tax=Actinoplanes sp. GCM10030250 TaxID=3273376 RepID=UPI00361C87C1
MTEHHGDRLREAFESHENMAPDPALVYARIEEIARKQKWRRRGVQAAGGVALSAGLIAGVTNLPALLPSGPAVTVPVAVLPAAAAPSAAPPTKAELEERWAAYFGAGYNYTSAVELAKLWQMDADQIGLVKAEGGRRLLAGETLPIQPLPEAEVTDPTESPEDKEKTKQFDAFFYAGYGWDDAEKLAKLWKVDDPSDAKWMAGKKILAGEELPIKPDPKAVKEAKRAQQASAFWEAGYDSEDAAKLAKLWKLDDTFDAKVLAGKKLLAGEELPIKP